MNILPKHIRKSTYALGAALLTIMTAAFLFIVQSRELSTSTESNQDEYKINLDTTRGEDGDISNKDNLFDGNSSMLPQDSEDFPAQTESQSGTLESENYAEDEETFKLNAGTVRSITFHNLPAYETTSVSLGDENFTFYALVWENGTLLTEVTDDNSPGNLQLLIPNDDLDPTKGHLVSELMQLEQKSSRTHYLHIQPSSQNDTIRIDLIETTATPAATSLTSLSSTGTYNQNSGAKYTTLNIVSRDTWGANPSSWDPYDSKDIDDPARFEWDPAYHPVSRIVVHHTATLNNPSDPAATVRAIYIYHAHSCEWGDIGYNFLIDHLGNIYEGKAGGDEVFGYHARTEANAMSIGIGVLGDFRYVYPTAAAQTAIKKLMAEKAAFYDFNLRYSTGNLGQWLDSSYTVFGHNGSWFWNGSAWQINATACPGGKLSELLGYNLTSQAQTYKNNNFSALKAVVADAESAILSTHEADKLIVMYNEPRTIDPSVILAKIPAFSGITNITVKENIATIEVKDWDTGGTVVPPDGWDGYNAPGTFFPAANGSDDRLKTLLKIFELDPNVLGAALLLDRGLFMP